MALRAEKMVAASQTPHGASRRREVIVFGLLFAFGIAAVLSACQSKLVSLDGEWEGDWGKVVIAGNAGTYSDTYGPNPGKLEFAKTGGRAFTGTWAESPKRHGTLDITLSSDGNFITGTWKPAADVTIGTTVGGTLNWTRKR